MTKKTDRLLALEVANLLDRERDLLQRIEDLEDAVMRLAGTESAARKAFDVPPPTDDFRARYRALKGSK